MIYRITHRTTYLYSEPVSLCHNVVHLIPRSSPRQHCLSKSLDVRPDPAVRSPGVDYFGHPFTFFTIQEPHQTLNLTARHLTEVTPRAAFDIGATPPWESVRDRLLSDRSGDALDAYQFTFDSFYVKSDAGLARYAAASFPPGRPLVEAVVNLTSRIHRDFSYDPKATTVTTPLSDVLEARRGVCQDFAHILIGCARALGLASRYVSGYLLTHPPPGQERLIGADASHAWASVWCPGLGWVDADPTNNLLPNEQHIVVAWGRDYDDVAPIKGVIHGGGQHTIAVGVDVAPAD